MKNIRAVVTGAFKITLIYTVHESRCWWVVSGGVAILTSAHPISRIKPLSKKATKSPNRDAIHVGDPAQVLTFFRVFTARQK
jgi:hypothetical protein